MLYFWSSSSAISPEDRRKSGKCPLTPEEAALVLAAAGFGPGTYVYLAGSRIYGGKSRMLPLMRLFPNLVTKEDLLTEEQLAPFKNFSSQVIFLLLEKSHSSLTPVDEVLSGLKSTRRTA